MGHAWADDPGMLPLSILLKNPPEPETLTARVGLAVCGATEHLYSRLRSSANDVKIGIKWPNDIIVANRKVCGILCESLVFGDTLNVIIGIGVNVSQTEEYFMSLGLPHAASLLTVFGSAPDRDALLREIAEAVKKRAAMPFSECYGEYRQRLLNLGKTVKIVSANGDTERVAFAEDVAPNGFLICRDENGVFEVNSGEVSVRGLDGYL